mmetsp:Transcript_8294/g.17928  ORF Transcript_8294/g.17928 Transcript_8294/m.17928 type:complete len:406 (+) Transcript_8294:208-1425(+)
MTEDVTTTTSSSSGSSIRLTKTKGQRRRADATTTSSTTCSRRVGCCIQFASDGRLAMAGTSTSCTSTRTRTDYRPSNIFPIMLLPILLSSMYDSPSTCVVSAFSPWATSCTGVFTRGKYRYTRTDRFASILNEQCIGFLHRPRRRRIATALFETKNAESAPNQKVKTRKKKAVKKKKADRENTRKAINEEAVPLYWRSETDEFVFVDGTTDTSMSSANNTISIESIPRERKVLKFTVRGKPIPLRRHRTSRGFMYNPSAKSQLEFRRVVSDMVCCSSDGTEMTTSTNDDDNKKTVIFDEHEYLAVSILFRLRRPKSHFVGGKPGPGRLRPTSPGRLHTTRTDVDNLAKFVLDSLNELVYRDDRQVISLHVAKVLDSEGHCEGATEVAISRLEESEMENFVANMIA